MILMTFEHIFKVTSAHRISQLIITYGISCSIFTLGFFFILALSLHATDNNFQNINVRYFFFLKLSPVVCVCSFVLRRI